VIDNYEEATDMGKMKKRPISSIRRGLSISGLLVVLASIASVGTVAWFASPIVLRAGSEASQDNESALDDLPDEFHGLVEALDILLRKSKATCLVRTSAGSSDSVEFIVLWVRDDDDVGHANESEVAVIRFSQFLGSVSVYAREERPAGFSKKQINRSVDSMLRDGSFIDYFLQDDDTRGRVIGVHITSMVIDGTKLSDNGGSSGGDSSLGRIELTYRGHSADTPVVAFVPTALPPLDR